jgi:hypothetical protein
MLNLGQTETQAARSRLALEVFREAAETGALPGEVVGLR